MYAEGTDVSADTNYVTIMCTQFFFRPKPKTCDLRHELDFNFLISKSKRKSHLTESSKNFHLYPALAVFFNLISEELQSHAAGRIRLVKVSKAHVFYSGSEGPTDNK